MNGRSFFSNAIGVFLRFGVLSSMIVFSVLFFSPQVFAANPSVPFTPSDNVLDPGDPGSTWGGCGPTDSNCYVTGGSGSVTTGNLTSSTSGLNVTDGTNAVVGSGTSLSIDTASGSQQGLLSAADWTTFNLKENLLSFLAPFVRIGNTVSLPQSNTTTDGYLSSTDWNTFNTKFSTPAGTTAQYVRGNGTLATFPTAVSSFSNDTGYVTPSSTTTLTNKSGNISQWTNNTGYITASSTDTLTNKSGAISQWTNDSGYITGVTWGDITGTLANQTDLQNILNAKEGSVTAGTSAQYYRGDKTWQTLDTSVVPENGNLYFTNTRFDTRLATKSTSDITEGSNLYYTATRFNAAFGGKSTSDLTEGSNLYYTNTRADARVNALFSGLFDTRLTTKTTDDLTEGATSKYYASSLFDTDLATKTTDDVIEGGTNKYYNSSLFATDFGTKSTSDLAEGTNLYYTNARAIAAPLIGFTSGAGIVSASDSVLSAIQKLDGNIIAATHNPVTIGTANGLSLSAQQISLGLASGSTIGALSATDWTTFNNKQNALSFGNLTSSTSGISITGGIGAVIGSGTSLSIDTASGSQNGLLSSTDWTTFNDKFNTPTGTTLQYITGDGSLAILDTSVVPENGNLYYTPVRFDTAFAGKTTDDLTEGSTNNYFSNTLARLAFSVTGTPLTYDNTTGIFGITQSDTSTDGYLSSTDWNTFNNKGNGTVTSVSGTTDRITSTGGSTPVLDISATFEGLLGKVADPLSQFASTTSAQLASIISDETGSGVLVFDTSPNLTTPVINVGSDATGDIYYRSGDGAFTRLGIGSTSQVLTVSGGLPSWGTPITGANTIGAVDAVTTGGLGFALSEGTTLNAISATGTRPGILLAGTQTLGGLKTIQSQSAANVPLTIQGAASQSGNLLNFVNSSGTSLLTINSNATSIIFGTASNRDMNGLGGIVTGASSSDSTSGHMSIQSSNNGNNPSLRFIKSGAALTATPAASTIGNIQFNTWSGTVPNVGGSIFVTTGAISSATNSEAFMSFATTPNASTTQVERMRIFSTGALKLGSNVSTSLGTLGIEPLTTSTVGLQIRARASQTGDLLQLQTSTPTTVFSVNPTATLIKVGSSNDLAGNGGLTVSTSSADTTTGIISVQAVNNGNTPQVNMLKTGTSLAATPSAVGLGFLGFRGYSGSAVLNAAAITATSVSTFSASNSEAYMSLFTTPNGSTTITERMRIFSTGAVKIGSNVSTVIGTFAVEPLTTATVGLTVRGLASQSSDLQQWQNSGGTVLAKIDASGNMGITQTTPSYLLDVGSSAVTGGDTVARFQTATGSCTVTPNTGMTCASDIRLKKNIISVEDGLARVRLLRPVLYNWNTDTDDAMKSYGFIAQEVEQVLPEIVVTGLDGYKQIGYQNLTPVLTKALQQLDLKLTDMTTLADTDESSFVQVLRTWLASATNGVTSITSAIFKGGEVQVQKVQTNEFCVDDTCLTKEELKSLIQEVKSRQVTSTPPTPENTPSPEQSELPAVEIESPSSDSVSDTTPVSEGTSVESTPVE